MYRYWISSRGHTKRRNEENQIPLDAEVKIMRNDGNEGNSNEKSTFCLAFAPDAEL